MKDEGSSCHLVLVKLLSLFFNSKKVGLLAFLEWPNFHESSHMKMMEIPPKSHQFYRDFPLQVSLIFYSPSSLKEERERCTEIKI